ncbi:MAG TPA: hypothetical protein VFW83_10350, partial [Bryobacteraceae bacterium]|nr:hypothetical protein [Bryobacteraceae bacterium]
PYRASAIKNRFRWQFGIVAPRAWSEAGGEPWEMQTECLIESQGSPTVEIAVRFLQVQLRTPLVDAGGEAWEEGVERIIELGPWALPHSADVPFEIPGGRELDPAEPETGRGMVGRERWPVGGVICLITEPAGRFLKLRVRIENLTQFANAACADRTTAMRHALAGAHTLLSVSGGSFVSLMDPPPEAKSAAESCSNLRTWPVLVGREGDRSVMLSSPIILQDYPAVAPESPGNLFDSTEIDELLTLRVMTLTDEEKREAMVTDDRARRIIERSDSIPPEIFERLHGAIRSKQPVGEEFFNPPDHSPEEASVEIAGHTAARGARVRIQPRRHSDSLRSDSMDLFLAGRVARIEAVHRDLENRVHVAVALEDDPAADLHGRYSRFYYFSPDELEIEEGGISLKRKEHGI